ncbi:photosynthetic reaction center cytochrome PufC [Blastomonas sp. CCH5-A3]|uniref:photosynthetic reaction center cytochrome PufC n=1 Tax=Blastomonas sp. CCH5-A3 TaxID=1768761 RepID=UPI0008257A64|nr:photosynthetic reaction center cytochrome PufC [Blastomonas sp. CCH5-A3]MAF61519.1 photosynthetic reaction center cytochrome c subunit [Blastomonas sp.]|tara:strand:+ start:48428 stop:49570 length:1143 start_codon:yes stop_codon:yes gene_type:complete
MLTLSKLTTMGALAVAALSLGACDIGPKTSEQGGFRGTGIAQISDPDNKIDPGTVPPPPYELPPPSGPKASEVYQNVKVLGHVSQEEFDYTMAAITQWIVPADAPPEQAGCNYCHNAENLADDSKYTKVVARRMIQMTQNINQNYSDHVKKTGVTCYTCHRGNAVPKYVWTDPKPSDGRLMGNKRGQNTPSPVTAYASLPLSTASMYLGLDAKAARVQSKTRHPTTLNLKGTKDAEANYAIMMHLSRSLNVNCTYCHNSRAFAHWGQSSPQRAQAWYGLQMVKNANQEYIHPLTSVFPANRLGPQGDPYKTNCATCHQIQRKPLGGAQMAKDYPALLTLGPKGVVPGAAPAGTAPAMPGMQAPAPAAAAAAPAAAAAAGN